VNITAQLMTNSFFKFESIFAQASQQSMSARPSAPETVPESKRSDEGRVVWSGLLHCFTSLSGGRQGRPLSLSITMSERPTAIGLLPLRNPPSSHPPSSIPVPRSTDISKSLRACDLSLRVAGREPAA
jgi:hypothetical protein